MRTPLDPLFGSCMHEDTNCQYKDVVVIGNGPSGLCLSYIFSGRWPHYNGRGHADLMLQARLQASSRSLLHADLPFLAQGVVGRSASPLGALFDQLLHPGADQGTDTPSLVDWKPHRAIDHVVIGKNLPGGVWQSMDRNVVTLSLSSWMELPGLSYAEWDAGADGPPPASAGEGRRVPAGHVAKYYADYVHRVRLAKYMKRGEVTSVTLQQEEEEGRPQLWKVEGVDHAQQPFTYVARNVVLATGISDIPNRLDVPGENDSDYIYHDLRSLEAALEDLSARPTADRGSVLVVGAGLSAADAVLAARFRRLNVVHIFRRRPVLSDRILPDSLYPEYSKVKQMMSCPSADDYPGYIAMAEASIERFCPDGTVILRTPQSAKTESVQVAVAAILIGSRPRLDFVKPYLTEALLGAERKRPLAVEPWSQRVVGSPNGLYALGPLVGDNFVRYLVGGAVGVASDIMSSSNS